MTDDQIRAWAEAHGSPVARSFILSLLDRLAAAEAERDRLRVALAPFAAWVAGWHENWPDLLPINETTTDDSPTLGDCRRAAAALAGKDGGL